MSRRTLSFLALPLLTVALSAAPGCGDETGGSSSSTTSSSSSTGTGGIGATGGGGNLGGGGATGGAGGSVGVCGDGNIDPGEDCDDSGESATCDIDCTAVDCGDGTLNTTAGEICDDGNAVSLDGCEPDCTETPAEIVCEQLTPLPSGTCEVTPGAPGGEQLIYGDILHPYTIYRGGQVLVDPTGMIACVGCDCAGQATNPTVINCPTGVVSPALINAHDHITYIQNDPYTDTGERYEHRHEWRRGLNGHTEISSTGNASTNAKHWGELRFLIGGATSTIGSGDVTGLLRNLDRNLQEGLGQPPVHYETFPLGDSGGTMLNESCNYPAIDTQASIAGDDAYFPHISEGINAAARNEFLCVSSTQGGGEDLLEPQSAFIHSIGLGPIDYGRMADQGTSLVWSPRSNVTLYGNTASVTVAARLGVRIALGTDWMPTGSMNVQRELACVDSLNQNYYDGFFSDRAIWHMVTKDAAGSAAMDDALGALTPGLVADIAIYDGATHSDYRAIIEAQPQDTVLVMRSGETLFGDTAVVTGLGVSGCDALDVCGSQKQVCTQADTGMTYPALAAANASLYGLFYCGAPPSEPSCHPERPVSVGGSTVYTGLATGNDSDGDGIDDAADNCPTVFNPIRPVDDGVQPDFDLDGLGDACDECPLDADHALCRGFDPNDFDLDGIANGSDICPYAPDPGQEDGDTDGKGDACDPCPAFSNPGAEACPATIYDIKQGIATGTVAVLNALVTGCSNSNGYFLQSKPGDPDYAGAEYSGVFVYNPAVICGTTLSVGDRVTLNPATVSVFFDQIQLTFATITVDASNAEASPAPVDLTASQAAGTLPNSYEGVLARVQNVLVTDVSPPPGPGDNAPTNEFEVDGVLRVNDLMFLISPPPALNTPYTEIVGILDYRNGWQKLEPRSAADVVEGPPILVDFGPVPSFVREGEVSVTTIPEPLEIILSSPVSSDTFVAVTSGDPTSLSVVGGGATVLAGNSTAQVLLDGVSQSLAVTLTATLDAVNLDADVRVVGAAEQPQVVAVTPATANVPVSGVGGFQVWLDIPADSPGGNLVDLALNPNTFGTVPANVLVPADTLFAPFDFTAGSSTGTELLTATLGASTANATINVVLGGGLVINEVDYDQPGTDNDEFVEIYNGGGTTVDLTTLALVLMNGSNNTEYLRVPLASAGTLANGEYLVVGSNTLLATVPVTAKTVAFAGASNNVQNGAPDAVGLLDESNGTLLDALSYEGEITAGNVSGVGPLSFVEGTATTALDGNVDPGSLIRNPNGSDTDDALADWAFTATTTPGEANIP